MTHFWNLGAEERWKPRAEMSPLRRRLEEVAKRAIDIAGASAGIVLTAPIMAGAAVAIRATMGRPVLFRQERPGRGERLFTMWKFRTMRMPRPGEVWHRNDAERLTPLGRFLRKSSIDELPTLFNVLRGEMSLVGPRPLVKEYLDRYRPEHRRRHEVRGGITGWAQIHGRQAIPFSKRLAYDVWYVDHWCVALDLYILWRTLALTLRQEGIDVDGSHLDEVDDLGLASDDARFTAGAPSSRGA